MPPADALYFVQHGSKDLAALETMLGARQRRCNMMMVKSCEQAQAILRGETTGKGPDLVIVWGAASDGRATKFAKTLRGKTPLVILADDAPVEAAAKETGADLFAPVMAEVERMLVDDSFWWVVVRFAQ